jgi:RNA polymerase sigma-70 factor (ECF subfamily)
MTLIDPSPFRRDDPLGGLLDRYLLSGDEEAMDEIVARTRGRLLAVARRIGHPQDAEDAVQTAYFSLIRKRGERLEAPVLPWLLTAVVRIAYRQRAVHQRQHRIARRLAKPPNAGSPLGEIANAEEAERARTEIARLPAKYRDPAVLRLLQGLDTKETAELLGLPEATVRTRLHRARRLLRSRWPSRVTHGFLFQLWLAADAGRTVSNGTVGFLSGITAPVIIVTAGLIGAAGGIALSLRENPERSPEAAAAEIEVLRREKASLLAEANRADPRSRRAADAEAMLLERRRQALAANRAFALRETASAGRFEVPVPSADFQEALSRVDWSVVGENIVELTRLIRKELAMRAKGEVLDVEFIAEKRRRNGALLGEVVKVWSELPSHENGMPHTHPAFMVNAIAATLERLELPLTPEQVARLAKIGVEYRRADARRKKAYDADTYELTRLREESELKERSLRKAREILTPAQETALFPREVDGRVGCDLLSPGLLWTQDRVRAVAYGDRGDLGKKLADGLKDGLSISESEDEAFRRIVGDWVAGLGDDVCAPGESMTLDDLHRMARKTETLLRTVERELPPNEQRSALLRYRTGVIVPVRVEDEN